MAGLGFLIPGWISCRQGAGVHVGDVPPKLTLNDLRGNPVVIPSDFRGRVAPIHFWASGCPACRGEMAAFESLYGRHRGKGVIPCSIGVGENRERAVSYMRNMNITYPVLLDPSSSAVKPFGVSGVPTTYILDREGVVRFRILGEADKDALDKMIRTLL